MQTNLLDPMTSLPLHCREPLSGPLSHRSTAGNVPTLSRQATEFTDQGWLTE